MIQFFDDVWSPSCLPTQKGIENSVGDTAQKRWIDTLRSFKNPHEWPIVRDGNALTSYDNLQYARKSGRTFDACDHENMRRVCVR